MWRSRVSVTSTSVTTEGSPDAVIVDGYAAGPEVSMSIQNWVIDPK